MEHILWASIFFGCFFSVLYGLKLKGAKYIYVLLLLVWVAAGYMWRESLAEGAVVSARYIIPDLSAVIHYEFPEFPAPVLLEEQLSACFCIYVLFPYTALLAWAVSLRRSGILSLLLTTPFFAFTYAMGELPQPPYMILQLLFWITMIIQPKPTATTSLPVSRASLLCICLTLPLLVFLFMAFPQDEYRASTAAYSMREDIVSRIVDIEYSGLFQGMPGFSGGAPLSNSDGSVNLNSTGNIRFPNKNVLKVYMEEPYDLYLRAYSSAVYTGSRWLPEDSTAFDAAGIGFAPLTYLDDLGDTYFSNSPSTILIEPLTGRPKYIFTPYLLTDIKSGSPLPEWEKASWTGDAYLSGSTAPQYSFKSYGSADLFPQIIRIEDSGFTRRIFSSYGNNVSGALDYEGYTVSYFSDHSGLWFVIEDSVPSGVLQSLSAYINNPTADVDTISLFYPEENLDAQYLRYIMEEYTKLPDGLNDVLYDWWLESKGDLDYYNSHWYGAYHLTSKNTPYWNWVTMAKIVSEVVSQSAEYNTAPGSQPRNRDFTEYFLTESNEGYCVHFASATVAMLRSLGIPARYVEGYVIREVDFDDDGWAYVPARNAHAWAEIWVPNFGWVPVDATPQSYYVPQNTRTTEIPPTPDAMEDIWFENHGFDEEMMADEYGMNLPDSQALNLPGENESPSASRMKSPGNKTVFLLSFVGFAGTGAAGIFICRILLAKRRNRLFNLKDTRKAALYIYGSLAKLLPYGTGITKAASDIALKARFSRHAVSAAEINLLKDEYESTRNELFSRLPGKKKFLLWLTTV